MAENQTEPRLGLSSIFVLLALAAVPGVLATGFTEFETVKSVTLMALAGLALITWGGGVLRGKTISMTGGRLVALLSAFAVFCLLALGWAVSVQGGLAPALHWVAVASLFVVVTSPVGRPLEFSDVALATAVGTAFAASLGLLDLMGLGGFMTEVWDPPGAAGSFDAREYGVGYYAVALPLLAGASVSALSGARRAFVLVATVLGAAHFGLVAEMDFLSIWAGAVGAATLLVLLLQGFGRVPLLYRPLLAVAVVTGLAFAIAALKPPVETTSDATSLPWVNVGGKPSNPTSTEIRDPRFSIRRDEEASNWEARSYVLGVAFDLLRAQPVIGHGPGGWWANQTQFFRQNEPFVQGIFDRWPAFRNPHNSLALVMSEYGAVGLLLLLAWFSALIGMVASSLSRTEEPEGWLLEHWALTAAVFGGFALAVVTPSLARPPAAVTFFVLAGLLVRESAVLNEFKGLAAVWTINRDGKKRFDTTVFCGALPTLLGVGMVVFAGWFGAAEFFRSWGDLALLRTQHQRADEVYVRADGILDGDGDVLLNRAIANKRLGRLEEAIDVVERAGELRPYDVRVMNMLAAIYLQKREFGDAAKAARKAVALFPNYVEGRRNLAAALDLQGRVSDAAKELLAILELDPPDDLRGQIHREVGGYYEGPLDNPTKALEHYKKAAPLLTDRFLVEELLPKIKELEKEVERRRLMREGKPIPPSLMPGESPNMPAGHGPHDGHDH